LKGACVGCMGAQMTLKMGVEKAIREVIPEIVRVEAV
jgi:Fe-S cluster biogenesis protein NfuA